MSPLAIIGALSAAAIAAGFALAGGIGHVEWLLDEPPGRRRGTLRRSA